MTEPVYLKFDKMYEALKRSCRNVRWKTSVTQFELNGLKNTAKTLREIREGKYKISKYQEFEIYEPKHRHITATRIKDRQLQRSLCDNYIYKEITKSFIYDNCACQKGKGTLFAIKRLEKHLQSFYHKYRNNEGYVLKCDIHHFFENIDHNIAKQLVAKQVDDKFAQKLIFDIIDSFAKDKGIGLGSQVSQLIALLYLNNLDHYIKEQLHINYYIRYMDDFILVHSDKEYLKHCLKLIQNKLKEVKLELNNKTSIQPLNKGTIFLHWKYILTNSGKVLLLPDKKKLRNNRVKLNKLKNLFDKGLITKKDYQMSLNGIVAHLKQGNAYKAIQQLINNQTKKKRRLIKQLITLSNFKK